MKKMLLICVGLMGMPLFAGLGNIGGLTSPVRLIQVIWVSGRPSRYRG